MSEQSNITLVQDLYDALNKGDTARVSEDLLHDQAKLHVPGKHPLSKAHSGKGNVVGFFGGIRQIATDVQVEPETIAASGDKVLAVVRIRGNRTGHSGPSSIDTRDVHVFTVTDGKVAEISTFAGDQHTTDAFLA